MEPERKIISYISRYRKGWAALATKEEAEAHQALFLPEGRGGIEPSEHIVHGTTWMEGVGYRNPKGELIEKTVREDFR